MHCILCHILVEKKIHQKHKTPSCPHFVYSALVVTATGNKWPKELVFDRWTEAKSIFFWLPCHTNATQEWLRYSCTVPPRFLSHQPSSNLFYGSLLSFFDIVYLALRSQSPCAQSRLAWCSWCRSQRCPLSSSAACPGGMSHRRSCLCTMQLRWETNNNKKKCYFFFKKKEWSHG